MPAISAPNATIIRYPYSAVKDVRFNVFPLEIHAEAEVLSSPTYPLDEVATTNETGSWTEKEDRLVRIYNSTATVIKFEGTVRAFSNLGLLRIARMQDGDTGTAQETAQTIVAGDLIKIYKAYVPRSFLSFWMAQRFISARILPMMQRIAQAQDRRATGYHSLN